MQQLNESEARRLDSATEAVSLLAIVDARSAAAGPVRFKAVLAQIERRLAALPALRRRLLKLPLGLDRPYWVDDERFDLEYHVRHLALPQPGDWRQLCIQVSRLHARPLDLQRPLWEAYVIEGLNRLDGLPRGSFALLLKLHPAALDARQVDVLGTLLHDDGPLAEPWFAQPAPAALPLATRGLLQRLASPWRLAEPMTRGLSRRLAQQLSQRLLHAGQRLRAPLHPALLRFNAVVSPHRVFESRRFDVAELHRIRRRVRGATLNDVVLAICGGALRRYLLAQGELPPPSHSLAAVLRGPDGTRLRADLAPAEADALQRLRHIQAQTRSSAAGAAPGPAAAPTDCRLCVLPAVPESAALCGARVSYVSALLPIRDGAGLAIAVSRHGGRVIVSPTSCRELMPDPERFAQALRESFAELQARAVEPGPRRPSRPNRREVVSRQTNV